MQVGDIVVCIDATKNKNVDYSMFNHWPVEGHRYKIRRLEKIDIYNRILFEGIKNKSFFNPLVGGKIEAGYDKNRFILESDFENYKQERISKGFGLL